MTKKLKQFKEEVKTLTFLESWQALRDNFTYGFLGSILVVFIAKEVDIMVLLGYQAYYIFTSIVINRPKYVTYIGRFILFPVPCGIGAYVGYELGGYISSLL